MPGLLSPQTPMQGQPQGLLGGFNQFVGNNSNALLGLGLGLLSGQGNRDAFQQGLRGFFVGGQADVGAAERKREQEEREAARRATEMALGKFAGNLSPEERAAFAGNPALANTLIANALKPPATTDDITEFNFARQNGFTGTFPEFLQQKKRATDAGQYGLNPVYGINAQGEVDIVQLGKDGEGIRPKLPEGFKPLKPLTNLDLGTSRVMVDPVTGKPRAAFEVDIAGEERAKVAGKSAGEAEANLPQALATANEMLDAIEGVRNHPGREFGTGKTGILPAAPGTQTRDFVSRLDQLKGKAFLQAFESLKGGGQITEREGQAATEAIARLDRAQSEEGFLEALDDLEAVVRMAAARAQRKVQQGSGAVPAPTDLKAKYGLE